jgi:hypothetical protein
MSKTPRINIFVRSTIAAGLIGAAAVGLAGTASASASFDIERGPDVVAVPDTYAAPAPNWVPWSSMINTPAHAPQVDTTVHQDR